MPLFNRDNTRPLTNEERVTAATEAANEAVRTFTSAAEDLEDAADELDAAALNAHETADYHRGVARNAETASTQSRSNAAKIRSLIDG